ncbi:hypothetical protein PMAYCL1PPCAC_26118 [Pristionchus mayeri]|uniref:Uncharacterized protein n=1 Tax=Pristionchus mayeri TaxID=1317129 RepID=A0AAN5D3E4_9BILA|nr:hypothetical protein PMAYCL1PPCAC_26118 [Pristionchus mayeri]
MVMLQPPETRSNCSARSLENVWRSARNKWWTFLLIEFFQINDGLAEHRFEFLLHKIPFGLWSHIPVTGLVDFLKQNVRAGRGLEDAIVILVYLAVDNIPGVIEIPLLVSRDRYMQYDLSQTARFLDYGNEERILPQIHRCRSL